MVSSKAWLIQVKLGEVSFGVLWQGSACTVAKMKGGEMLC